MSDLDYWRAGTKIIEECLANAIKADPGDVPFPLVGAEAKLWHQAQAVAYQHALEMMGMPSSPARAVVIQLINPGYDLSHTGLRLVVDGEVIDTGDFGGEPEDNIECRDYKWVKTMLVALAKRLGADARIETVEVDGSDDRQLRQNYYAAMAAPYRAPESKP